jgi:hypothetical protein
VHAVCAWLRPQIILSDSSHLLNEISSTKADRLKRIFLEESVRCTKRFWNIESRRLIEISFKSFIMILLFKVCNNKTARIKSWPQIAPRMILTLPQASHGSSTMKRLKGLIKINSEACQTQLCLWL